MERIKMEHGEATKLARDFNVSKQTVTSALKGLTKSKLAHMLRETAKERGAGIVVKCKK